MPRNWESMSGFEAFLNAGGIVESDDAMPDDYRRAVFRFVEFHANSELMGALTERDWIPKAPGLRHKIEVLGKTQDEIGHAHLLYTVAADLGLKTRPQLMEDLFAGKSRFHNVFHYQAKTWGDQVAIAFLVEGAALISQQAVFKNCSYGPYKRALKRILAEETVHQRSGHQRMRRVAEGTETQRATFQQAIDDWWWPALRLFGPDSVADDVLPRWHIKSENNEVLRDRWLQMYVPLLQEHGFTVPDGGLHCDESGLRWVSGPIDWEPLTRTMANNGPDSSRRLGEASGNWRRTAWVRRAMDKPQLAAAEVPV